MDFDSFLSFLSSDIQKYTISAGINLADLSVWHLVCQYFYIESVEYRHHENSNLLLFVLVLDVVEQVVHCCGDGLCWEKNVAVNRSLCQMNKI